MSDDPRTIAAIRIRPSHKNYFLLFLILCGLVGFFAAFAAVQYAICDEGKDFFECIAPQSARPSSPRY